jgi:hypothetical protein
MVGVARVMNSAEAASPNTTRYFAGIRSRASSLACNAFVRTPPQQADSKEHSLPTLGK